MRVAVVFVLAFGLLAVGLAPGAAALHEQTRDCAPTNNPVCQAYNTARMAPHQLPPVPDVGPCESGIGVVVDETPVCVEGKDCSTPPGLIVAAGAVVQVGADTVDSGCFLVGLEEHRGCPGIQYTIHPTGLKTACIIFK